MPKIRLLISLWILSMVLGVCVLKRALSFVVAQSTQLAEQRLVLDKLENPCYTDGCKVENSSLSSSWFWKKGD